MSRPCRRRLHVAALAALLAAVSFAVPVRARQAPKSTESDTAPPSSGAASTDSARHDIVMLADFGFGGLFPADRWGPITLEVTAGDQPLSGSIIVEFPQDSTQRARISVPFAATPGRTTPVPIVASLPALCDRITFTMVNDRGTPLRSITYDRTDTDVSLNLPPFLGPERALLVAVGRTSLVESSRDWGVLYSAAAPGNLSATPAPTPAPRRTPSAIARDREEAWSATSAARVEPDTLPTAWPAYDGVRVLVVNPLSTPGGHAADPRAQDAVKTWVRSGGRLVLLADAPGEAWRAWLPDEAGAAITLSDSHDAAIPTEVRDAIEKAAKDTRDRAADDPERADLKADVPPPAAGAPCRLLRLTDAGLASGWHARWLAAADKATSASAPVHTGLLAEGPAGFGFVTVLGLDPARAPATLSTRATAGVWRDALQTPLGDWLDTAASLARARAQFGWVQTSQERATNSAIARLGNVPIPGDWLFLVIAGAIGLMAVMVGPVDYFILKRLGAGQRSWLTALGWIALASLAAYTAPRLLRAAPTRVNRISSLDCILPGLSAAADPSAPRTAFVAGLTGIYSGESGMARLVDPDLTSWWHGTSPIDFWRRSAQGLMLGGIVPTTQAAAGGQAGSARGNPLLALPISLWTFRLFSDLSTTGPSWFRALNGHITRDADGYSVTIAGLPPNATIASATLRIGEDWLTLAPAEREVRKSRRKPDPRYQSVIEMETPESSILSAEPPPPVLIAQPDNGLWTVVFPGANHASHPPLHWKQPEPQIDQFGGWISPAAPVDPDPGPILNLPGPDRRQAAIDALVRSRRWAALYLDLSGLPAEPRLSWPCEAEHACVARILIPIPDGTIQDLSP